MSEPARIPMVECHGGPLDGYVTRWPLLDGQPCASVEFRYAASGGADGEEDPTDYHNVIYLYVDRSKAIWRGMRLLDPPGR